ncbi:MAG TPA: hypothetical protein ENO20_02730 [Bacteroides sp.]|nr:hypothetical protein [Bacteroides sp.]
MKRPYLFFFLLLAGWIIFASYWYVCRIRDDCRGVDRAMQAEAVQTLPAETVAEDAGSKPVEDSAAIALDHIREIGTRIYYFDFASAEMKAGTDDDMYLSSLRTYLRNTTDASVIIEGHSDNRGSYEANEKFAKLRAEAARDYFIKNGIDGVRIRTVSRSDTRPAASNDSEDGRKLNRRVEITVN